MSCSLFYGWTGLFRIFSLIFGIILLALVNAVWHGCVQGMGVSLYSLALMTLSFSLIWCFLYLLGVITDSGVTKTTDMVYHIVGGIFLIIASILWLIGTGGSEKALYIVTGVIGLTDGCIFITVALLICQNK